MQPMKAMLLAAGLGTRLRPWTDDRPKCMVTVAGRPMIDWTIDWLHAQGIDDLVVNLHHQRDIVVAHLGDGRAHGVRIAYSAEESLLGTAGAVVAARDLLGPGRFLVVYADNLIRCDLPTLLAHHDAAGAAMTVALHWRTDVSTSGVAELEPDDRVRQFVEKPRPGVTSSQWVSAGLLVCEETVHAYIPRQGASDFGRDVIPTMIADGQHVHGYRMEPPDRLLWIDTPEDLVRTEHELAADTTR